MTIAHVRDLLSRAIGELPEDPAGVRSKNYLNSLLIPGLEFAAKGSTGWRRLPDFVSFRPIAKEFESIESIDKRTLYELSYLAPISIDPSMVSGNTENERWVKSFKGLAAAYRDVLQGAPAVDAVANIENTSIFVYNRSLLDGLSWAPPGLFASCAKLENSHYHMANLRDRKGEFRSALIALTARTLGGKEIPSAAMFDDPDDCPAPSEQGAGKIVEATMAFAGSGRALVELYTALPDDMRRHVTERLEWPHRASLGLPVDDDLLYEAAWTSLRSPSTRPEINHLALPAVQRTIMADPELLENLARQVFVPFLAAGNPRLVKIGDEKFPTRTKAFQKSTATELKLTGAEDRWRRPWQEDWPAGAEPDRDGLVYVVAGWRTTALEVTRNRLFARAVYEKAGELGLIEPIMTDDMWSVI